MLAARAESPETRLSAFFSLLSHLIGLFEGFLELFGPRLPLVVGPLQERRPRSFALPPRHRRQKRRHGDARYSQVPRVRVRGRARVARRVPVQHDVGSELAHGGEVEPGAKSSER